MGTRGAKYDATKTIFEGQVVEHNHNSANQLHLIILMVSIGVILSCCQLFIGGCSKKQEQTIGRFADWNPETDKEVSLDFKNAFDEYWLARSRLDWPTLYKMEAPHIRWAYSDTEFFRKFGRAGRVVSVTVLDVDKLHPQVVDARLKVLVKSPITGKEDTLYPRDRWIKVGGKWYHVWKIPLLDKFA